MIKRLDYGVAVTGGLLDWVDRVCESGRVYKAICAIHKLEASSPEYINRILLKMHHYSPSPLTLIDSNTKEPSCLEAALALLESTSDVTFNVKVIQTIQRLLETPPVYSTRNHVVTTRRIYTAGLLDLLTHKASKRIRKFQQDQEVKALKTRQENELLIQAGHDPRAQQETTDPIALLYESILSAVQTYLNDSELPIRCAAARFIKEVAVESYSRVIAQQIGWWAESEDPVHRMHGMSAMVALVFRHSPLLDKIISFFESPSERVRQAAITCLSEFVFATHAVEKADQFFALLAQVKLYITQVVGDVMESDMCSPTLSLFSGGKEAPGTKLAAFTLLYHARHFTHSTVSDAIEALEDEKDDLVETAISYLTMAALIATDESMRAPAITSIAGRACAS